MEFDRGNAPRPTRRVLLAASSLLLFPISAIGAPASGKLAFAVFRNGVRVGDHTMTFAGAPGAMTVSTQVAMTVKLGPVPVYKYSHRAVEKWSGGKFASLETTTNGNGKIQKVTARRTDTGVTIEAGKGRVVAAATAAPFTHWNPAVLAGPLFNPQDGKILRVSARKGGREAVKTATGSVNATRWSVTGDAQIDDWYDDAGNWTALKGKLEDGSMMEYRRL